MLKNYNLPVAGTPPDNALVEQADVGEEEAVELALRLLCQDGMEALPVPTSLLIDADGKVLWKDQSENYQRRSGPEVVLAALQRHLD